MKELILEIGVEELPAGFIEPACTFLKETITSRLEEAHLATGETMTYATPVRLGLIVKDIPERQEDRIEEVLGPKVAICFDDKGEPTKVAKGFAKGQGVEVGDLAQVETEKGLIVKATKEVKGRATKTLLETILPETIGKIPFKKSMRWGEIEQSFARPVHHFLALFGGEIVDFSFAGIRAGDTTKGHRFMAPDAIRVSDSGELLRALEAAYVMPFVASRKAKILMDAKAIAEEAGGTLLEDEALALEAANLTEYPVPLLGGFDEAYLDVPKEIIIDAMVTHQRYFAIVDDKGALLPKFVFVANLLAKDESMIIKGNERVLRARLDDARFFFEEDTKKPLADFAQKLESVTFEEHLGTIAEKVSRIREQIRYLASFVDGEALQPALACAKLAKADLTTNVVYEFPDLEGLMGGIYARREGIDEAIAQGIEDHYRPRFSDDALPRNDIGALVAIADKFDTIVGCFGVGLIPTGGQDPYALRRQALGILRILIDTGYKIQLQDWLDFTLATLKDKLTRDKEETAKEVLAFLEARYVNYRKKDFPIDAIHAVLSAGFDILATVEAKIEALAAFQKSEGFLPLAVAFKRVMNILKERPDMIVDPSLFAEEAEKALWKHYQQTRDDALVMLESGDYRAALVRMAELKPAVDAFFDDVLVMAKEEKMKNNRLALLGFLADLFNQIADFRKIQTEN